MFYKAIYRRFILKIIWIIYRDIYLATIWLIRRFLAAILWRFVPAHFRPPKRFVDLTACRQQSFGNTYSIATQNDQINALWPDFDFENLRALKRVMFKYGPKTAIYSVDCAGRSVSHWIASAGTKVTLQYIANCDSKLVDAWRNDRDNPIIHVSLLSGNFEVTDSLIQDYGLDVTILDNQDLNAMMHAAMVNQYGFSIPRPQDLILRCFIFGIGVNDRNSMGQTSLHYAVQSDSLQSVHLALWLGGNPTFQDCYGRTPYDYALLRGNKSMAKVLAHSWLPTKRFGLMRNFILYIRLLFYNSSSRWRESRFWIGVVIICFQLVASFGYLIPTYFMNYFDLHSLIWPIHLLLITIICATIIVGYFVVFGDPGFVSLGRENYFEFMRHLCDPAIPPLERCRMISTHIDDRSLRLCYVCQCIATDDIKHCYHCGRCCAEYDHHCVFLFTCIGRANVYRFIAFTTLLASCGIVGMIVIAYSAHRHIADRYQDFSGTTYYTWRTFFYHLNFHHFLDGLFCFKYICIGCTLAIATVIKRRYFFGRKSSEPTEPIVKIDSETKCSANRIPKVVYF